jgi:uncharacterized membrane protein YuzA (DUF378 family)
MKALAMIGYWLVVIGGINWGLIGLGGFAGQNWNVVNLLLGSWPQVEWLVYVLVGLSTVWMLVMTKGKPGMK